MLSSKNGKRNRNIKSRKKRTKRLSEERMVMINNIYIPAMPGTPYHAIMCSLVENKNKFTPWGMLRNLFEKYFVMYGSEKAWKKFASSPSRKNKIDNEYLFKKIKSKVTSLTRRGKKYISYKFHQCGMAVYLFKDGAMMRVGGIFVPAKGRRPYNVQFENSTTDFQEDVKNKISYREYKDIVDENLSDQLD